MSNSAPMKGLRADALMTLGVARQWPSRGPTRLLLAPHQMTLGPRPISRL